MFRVTSVALAIVALAVLVGAQSQDRPDLQLKAAVYKETVEGDLQGAVALYKQIVSNAAAPRSIAAAALLGLGGCYEKIGEAQAREARKAYERLVAEYPDQAPQAAAARQRLAALTAGAPLRAVDSRLAIRRVPDLDMYARPSPDGKYLSFTKWKSGNLAVLDVVTGATRELTKDGVFGDASRYAEFSAWSPDSRKIACAWAVQEVTAGRAELRIVSLEAETAHETITIPGARWVEPLEWSPDGSRILCAYGAPGGGSALALVPAAGGAITRQGLTMDWFQHQFTQGGEAILYSASADGKAGPRDIFLRNLKTGTTTAVVENPGDDLLVGVLPGTDWLFFASDRRGHLDLWAVPFRNSKADGQPLLVKQGLGRFYPLGFTRDGRYYYATLSATDDVFLADFDPNTGRVTGEARKLATRWDGVSGGQSFSPDGASLAYVVKRGPSPLPLHTADSLVVQSLKDPKADPVVVAFEEFGLAFVHAPCWLADGNAVVLGGERDHPREKALYRVDLPGLRKTRIYSPAGGRQFSGFECSSDGPFIYVRLITPGSEEATGQLEQVVRIDAAGGNEREVFRAPQGQAVSSYRVALSPDGRMLAVATRLDRYRRALLVVPSEGGPPRQVLEFRQHSGGGVAHTWAPDGRSILYVQWPQDGVSLLRSVRADGTSAAPETIFQWPGQFFGLRFHPAGRMLAFTGRPNYSTSSEVWVMENLREELKVLTSAAKRP